MPFTRLSCSLKWRKLATIPQITRHWGLEQTYLQSHTLFHRSHFAKWMHTVKHTVALCTGLFHVFSNMLPCSAVHHHSMSAAAGVPGQPTLCHQLKKAPGLGGGEGGSWSFAVGSGSYQEPQHRAAPGQFAYGWHSHHAGHQQPDGFDEAFSTMRDFRQWQFVDQTPEQHWHLHARPCITTWSWSDHTYRYKTYVFLFIIIYYYDLY